MTARGVLGYLALAALAAGSWWLARDRSTAPAPSAPTAVVGTGYFLHQATVTQTDASGAPLIELTTDQATQEPDSTSVLLGPLTAHYYPSRGGPWLATADAGRLSDGATTVELDGHVTLTGIPAPHMAPAVVRTEQLSLDTATSVATSSVPVRIELGGNVVNAVGLRADLKSQRLWLESDVHGHYAP
jgi:LPS export ABC transporter protein LptC